MTKGNPKVSIVIPVYNGSDYLQEAIDSALAQTYDNFEVIVVNDGSTDAGKSEAIAKSYGKKIRYFYKKNGGVASALNFGIGKMRGEWFSWLSHDDIYLPNKLTEQVELTRKHPIARFIFSAYTNIDEKGNLMKKPGKNWIPATEPYLRQMLTGNKFSGCATLIHKSCFKKTGLFNEQNKLAQDYEMWIKMALHFRMYRCPGVLLKRRFHSGMGSVTDRMKHKKDIKQMMKRIESEISIYDVFPDKLTPSSTPLEIAECHLKLGEIFMQNWHSDLANKQYRIASELWPSWKNPAHIRSFIGADLFHLRKTLLGIYWELSVTLTILQQRLKGIINNFIKVAQPRGI